MEKKKMNEVPYLLPPTSKSFIFGVVAFISFLVVFPFINNDSFTLHLMTLVAINSMVALGLQLLFGFCGQLSIGQAAFYGIGAYTSGLLTTKLGLPFPLALICAGLMASIVSLLMVPITRLSGVYLAVSTIGFSILVHLFLKNEEWLTGGTFGLIGIPRVEILGFKSKNPMYSYFLCISFAVVTYFGLYLLEKSSFGRAIKAIQQNEDAARASGLSVTLLKSQCFVIAAFVAGLAGSLYAHEVRYLAPDDFSFWKSIEFLFMVVIGGVGSLFGAILGAIFIVILPEVLRDIGDYRMVVFGGLIIIFMLFGQAGLAGLVKTLMKWFNFLLRVFNQQNHSDATNNKARPKD
jgi:branched-chain amino acid transport system permease protein